MEFITHRIPRINIKSIHMNAYILTERENEKIRNGQLHLTINGRSFAEILFDTLIGEFDHVMMVGKDNSYPHLPFLKNKYPEQTPLTHILSALNYSDDDWNFIVEMDIPAISKTFIEILKNEIKDHIDAILPVTDGRSHSTCALYHLNTISIFETALQQEKHNLRSIIRKIPCKHVNMDEFRSELIHVNTQVEFELLKRILSKNG